MFLEKYVSELYFAQIIKKYSEDYLNILDEQKFLEICALFKKYNFYFLNDIVLSYLEIFQMDVIELNKKLLKLKEIHGDYFNVIIGNDLTLLEGVLGENYD